jgi:hypothetical protein
MLKKLQTWARIEVISYSKWIGFAFVSSLLFSTCNSGGNKNTTEDTSAVAQTTPTPTNPPAHRQNWLEDIPRNRWDTLHFNPDTTRIENEKRRIQSYVWDSLSAYNKRMRDSDPNADQYIVDSFYFERRPGSSTAPVRFLVKAFLTPEARHHPHPDGASGHLIPSEPPPPQ